MSAQRAVVVVAVILAAVALTLGAIALYNSATRQPYPAAELGSLDARQVAGSSKRVVGIIEASEMDLLDPWTSMIDVRTAEDRVVRVILNQHSQVSTSSLTPVADLLADGAAFPYAVVGYRFDGTVKSVGLGFLGLDRWLVVETGAIGHP